MTEHKFTDEEVIKAFEKCISNDMSKCEGCPYSCWGGDCALLENNLLDLINRQKAEIERLEAMIDAAEEHFDPLPFKNKFDEYIEKSKAEAVKEFADRLKAYYRNLDKTAGGLVEYHIDQILKEMTEGNE